MRQEQVDERVSPPRRQAGLGLQEALQPQPRHRRLGQRGEPQHRGRAEGTRVEAERVSPRERSGEAGGQDRVRPQLPEEGGVHRLHPGPVAAVEQHDVVEEDREVQGRGVRAVEVARDEAHGQVARAPEVGEHAVVAGEGVVEPGAREAAPPAHQDPRKHAHRVPHRRGQADPHEAVEQAPDIRRQAGLEELVLECVEDQVVHVGRLGIPTGAESTGYVGHRGGRDVVEARRDRTPRAPRGRARGRPGAGSTERGGGPSPARGEPHAGDANSTDPADVSSTQSTSPSAKGRPRRKPQAMNAKPAAYRPRARHERRAPFAPLHQGEAEDRDQAGGPEREEDGDGVVQVLLVPPNSSWAEARTTRGVKNRARSLRTAGGL